MRVRATCTPSSRLEATAGAVAGAHLGGMVPTWLQLAVWVREDAFPAAALATVPRAQGERTVGAFLPVLVVSSTSDPTMVETVNADLTLLTGTWLASTTEVVEGLLQSAAVEPLPPLLAGRLLFEEGQYPDDEHTAEAV